MPPIAINTPLKRVHISSIPLLEKRSMMKGLVDISQDMELAEIFSSLGRVASYSPDPSPVNNWIFHTWSKDSVQRPIDTTGATISGSGSATITLTLADAGSILMLRKNDVLWVNGKEAFVKNVDRSTNPPVATLKSVDGTNLTLVAGTVLYLTGSAFGSGAAPAENLVYGFTKHYNYIQIFREHDEYTDVAGRTPIELEINGSMYVTQYEEMMKLLSLMRRISSQMVAGQITPVGFESASPTISDFENKAVQKFRGIDQSVTGGGIQFTLNSPGTLAGADLTDLNVALRAAKAPKDYLWLMGGLGRPVFSDFFKNITGSGGISKAQLSVDGRNIDLMVDGVTLPSGQRIQIVDMPILDDVDGIGGIDSFAKASYLIPAGRASIMGGAVQPYMRMRYLDPQYNIDAASGKIFKSNGLPIREIRSGGISQNATDGTNIAKTDWTCYAGLEMIATEHSAKITLAS